MSSWEPWLAEGGQLKYRGIVEAIEADLKSGRFSRVTGCRRSE